MTLNITLTTTHFLAAYMFVGACFAAHVGNRMNATRIDDVIGSAVLGMLWPLLLLWGAMFWLARFFTTGEIRRD